MEKEVEKILERARELILKDGFLVPTIFLFKKGKVEAIAGLMGNSVVERMEAVYRLGREVKAKGIEVDGLALVSEGWMGELDFSSEYKRREVVVLFYGKKGNYKLKTLLKRSTPDGPLFEEIEGGRVVKNPVLDMFWAGYERKTCDYCEEDKR